MAMVFSSFPATIDASAVPTEPIFRLSVAQYHEMIRTGILEEGSPVELLEGWLVKKRSKNPPHAVSTQLTYAAVSRCLPPGWIVRSQDPITTNTSEPEPDLSIVRGNTRDFADRHPGPKDVALVVEVADASLERDRGRKKRIYARARIPIYWIINLIDNKVEVYSDPSGPGKRPDFRQQRDYAPNEQIPLTIDGKVAARLKVRDLLS